jgi:D-inositol-3-phosphate glycosyltransferase
VPDPLRILFALEYYAPHIGGAEILFQTIAEGLAADGHCVTVFTQGLPGCPGREDLNGVRILRASLPPPRRFWFTFATFPTLARLAREADVIHASTYAGTFSASLAGRMAGKPVALTVHEIWVDRWRGVPFVPLWQRWTGPLQERFLLRQPYQAYLPVSRATRHDLERHMPGAHPVHLVPAAVSIPGDLRRREEPGRGARAFVYFGRPGHWRGVDVLLKAFAGFLRAGGDATLDLILGREPRREFQALLGLRGRLEAGDRIRVLDPLPREALFAHLLRYDAAVFPSLSEGFGLAAAETCALGIPVVASTAGALPEVVSGHHLLVPPGDETALAEALAKAAAGRWDWSEPRRFPVEDTLDALYKVYRTLIP